MCLSVSFFHAKYKLHVNYTNTLQYTVHCSTNVLYSIIYIYFFVGPYTTMKLFLANYFASFLFFSVDALLNLKGHYNEKSVRDYCFLL
jgi:hypothetical protein